MKPPIAFLGLAVLATAAVAPARAQTPPEALTWMVLDEINSAYFDRTEPFNRPPLVTRVPEGVIRPVDISHDGKPDWLIDYTDSGLMYCGTGGCLRTLYVSDGDDHVMAFDEQTHTFELSSRGGETVIEVEVHHVFCGAAGDDCAFAWTWDPVLKQLVERPNAAGVTLLGNDGGFAPLGARDDGRPVEDGLPAELSAVWHGARLTCASTDDDGFRVFRPAFKSVPDLNGDGRRDWLARLPDPCPGDLHEEVQAQPFRVWLTGPDGSLAEAWTSAPDHWALIDIATTPARLVSNPSCGIGTACPDRRLRWDAAASTFVPVD
ncbi:MAG: hypothetical protein ACK4VY_13105 [Brevundimonas sp.]